MKAFLLTTFFLFILLPVQAQVKAGMTDGLAYQALDILLIDSIDTFEPSKELSDSIDVTGDGMADVRFEALLTNYIDYTGGVASIRSLNNSVRQHGPPGGPWPVFGS